MSANRSVLVTGATGQQGGAVAKELLKKGFAVKAMTRKPESENAKALASLGAEIIYGDLNDAASLESALKGVWGTFAVQNTWEAGVEAEEEQGKRFAEAAKKAGVQHYVYTSVGSAHKNTGIPHFDNKWRVEEKVRSLGFDSYVIIRPVFFMENFASPWFKPAIDGGTLAVAIKPDTKLQMISVEDIGKYGAWAFDKAEELNGRDIDVAGDELTMPEVADLISKTAGRQINFVSPPIEEVRKFSEDFALMLEWFDAVGYSADIKGTAQECGIKHVSFAEWVKRINW